MHPLPVNTTVFSIHDPLLWLIVAIVAVPCALTLLVAYAAVRQANDHGPSDAPPHRRPTAYRQP